MTQSVEAQQGVQAFEDVQMQSAYSEAVEAIYAKAAEGESDIRELVLRPVAEATLVHMSEPRGDDFYINNNTFTNSVAAILEQLKIEQELDPNDTIAILQDKDSGVKSVLYQDGSGNVYAMSHQGGSDGENAGLLDMSLLKPSEQMNS
jgi:hypothetical protein